MNGPSMGATGAAGAVGATEARAARARAGAIRFLAFASGAGILVLEVTGARLVADTYGLSSIPWTVVIATVLTGFTLGNWIGGIAADRGRASLAALFLGAGLWAAVPVVAIEVPDFLVYRVGILWGVTISAGLFFLVPALLMGAATPALVTLATTTVDEVGERFGEVGGWSTAGAIAGTLAGGLLLVPALGLRGSFALVAGLFLLSAALAAAMEGRRRFALAAAGLAPFAATLALAPALGEGRTVHLEQSLYASLRVVDSEWYGGVPARELWQNGSLSSAENRVTGEPLHYYQVTQGWILAERIGRLREVLVLGGAAQTFPSQLVRWIPEVRVKVVEIDPMSVRVAREYFSFGRLPEGAIEVVVQDARPFLARDRGSYDVILLDAYDHLYSIPWPLMTREAFRDVEARLAPGGIVGLTVSTALEGPAAAFLRRLVATLGTVFGEVRVFPSRPGEDPTATQEVVVVAARTPADAPVAEIPWVRIEPAGAPLRDDFAPVEFLQAVRFVYDRAW